MFYNAYVSEQNLVVEQSPKQVNHPDIVFILQSLMEKGINSTSKGSISYFSEQAIFTATKTSIASSNCSMEINVGANLIFESSGSCMPG